MPYDIQARLDTLGSRFNELNQHTIVYKRGNVAITIPNVSPVGRETDDISIRDVASQNFQKQSFAFDAHHLTDASLQEPRNGDQITWNGQAFVLRFRDAPLYRYTTASKKRIIVDAEQEDLGP